MICKHAAVLRCGVLWSLPGPCNESENALVQHLFMGAWKPAEALLSCLVTF